MAPAARTGRQDQGRRTGARRGQGRRGLTVAVTGPTGEIGRALLRDLDRTREVGTVLGMARRPFHPARLGLRKVEYRQGDVLDRAAVDRLVADADVVVHLAFVIMDDAKHSRAVNLDGSRNVFEAAVAAGVDRLVYTSSVAAYGFHEDNPDVLDEDVPARGSESLYYSAQKAELERTLAAVTGGGATQTYVFRPCIVAGPEATMLVRSMPYVQIGERLPGAVRALFDQVPILKPVLPDPGVPFQLVHHDDVASALRAAILGRGAPGVYNLAGPGELTVADLAGELGWYALPVPELATDATAEIVARLPFLPAEAAWVQAFRRPVLLDCARARRELRWRPRRSARQTLRETVAAHREDLGAA
jgi:nucleoside-diphosphate-sugar epimerase